MPCTSTQLASRTVWNTLAAASHAKCTIGEESITDFLVLGLKLVASSSLNIEVFTKHAESRNGADWELCLIGKKGSCLHLRIQAKIINARKLTYDHLHPPRKGRLTQAQKLIAASIVIPATPIYCLYSNWGTGTIGAPSWTCGTHPADESLFGISVVSAHNIVLLRATRTKTLAGLSPYMTPFHCLFCCRNYGGDDLASAAHAYVKDRIDKNAILLKAPPPHVRDLIERRRLGNDEVDDYFPDDDNLSRVVVIRENG
jgi:hypothetical protein